jgi:hypothetical protein
MPAWLQGVARSRLLDAGFALIALLSVLQLARSLPPNAVRNDFAHYYLSSRLLWEGGNVYQTPLQPLYAAAGFQFEGDVPTATNPPALIWLFVPFARLPAGLAFWCWVAAQAVALGIILWLTRNLLGDRLSGRGWFYVWVAVLSSAMVYWHFQFSQVQLILAALVLFGYRLRQQGLETLACLLVTMAGLIKLYPLALLPWFVWGTDGLVRQRLKRLAVVVIFTALAVGGMGISLWADFLTHGLAVVTQCSLNHTFNFTVPSLLLNLCYAAYDFRPPASVAQTWWAIGVVLGMVLIAVAYWLCWRSERAEEMQFGLLTVAMLAGGVTSWGHYLVFLIFPLAALATQIGRNGSWQRASGFVFLLLLLNTVKTMEGGWLNNHIYVKIFANELPLLAMLIFYVWFARMLTRRTTTVARSDS